MRGWLLMAAVLLPAVAKAEVWQRWDPAVGGNGHYYCPEVANGILWAIERDVPEPSTLVLLAAAGLGLAGWVWQRRKQPA
jgi:hypothetical protein